MTQEDSRTYVLYVRTDEILRKNLAYLVDEVLHFAEVRLGDGTAADIFDATCGRPSRRETREKRLRRELDAWHVLQARVNRARSLTNRQANKQTSKQTNKQTHNHQHINKQAIN